jgi:DNA-binding Xre family transcriptional regulator
MRELSPLEIAVKKRLIDLRMRQKDLAAAIGVKPCVLSNILAGRQWAAKDAPGKLLEIKKVLDLPPLKDG